MAMIELHLLDEKCYNIYETTYIDETMKGESDINE